MKLLATVLFFFLFLTGAFSQTRNVLVNTSSVVVQPTNFWSADASNARSGLGLGSAATNPASVFQPSSTVLSNLANSNAADLTNITISNLGTIPITGGGTGATNAATARTNLGLGATWLTNTNVAYFREGIGLGPTNEVNFNAINATNIGATDLSGALLGTIKIVDSATTNSFTFENPNDIPYVRTNIGLGAAWLTNTNATNFRSAIGLGLSSLTNTNIANFRSDIGLGLAALTNTNASNFRSAVGLGWTALTNSNSGNSLISYNSSNNVVVGIVETNNISFSNSIVAPMFYGSDGTSTNIGGSINIGGNQSGSIDLSGANVMFGGIGGSIIASGTHSSTGGTLNMSGSQLGNGGSITTKDGGGSIDTRGDGVVSGGSIDTSLGGGLISTRGTGTLELGTNGTRTTITGTATTNRSISFPNGSGTIALLTNSSSGVSLVTVNSNGSVLSPTNFWQKAPIQTLVQNFVPVTNSTNAGTNARNLYVYSLATNISGVTNVITLPTNADTFVGDNATVIHRGTTNSVTAIRQAGQSTNLIVISNYDDAIAFIHENGTWDFYHNISFVEPIKFTDGNLEFNKATSRTNLGIPLAALTNTNNASFQSAIFQTNTTPASAANLSDVRAWLEISSVTNNVTNSFRIPLFQ